ncbi:MAG TPA: DnaB-like helicase C-terminal domain-containing protein [Bryobacteraceae bacterium]|nr:DnaB-like helicase C-terminal domain-containing protein [Bryobacteraceae bacterium]
MARINQAEEIKRATDIVRVIGQYVQLRKAGAEYEGLCPFHQEKTPSFKVNPAGQFYKCFGCGKGGDVFQFVKDIEGVTFPQAVERVGGATLPAGPQRPNVARPSAKGPKPKKEWGPVVAEYVYTDKRGTPLFKNCRHNPKDFHVERFENGAWVKGIGNARKVLYRLPRLADAETVYLTEGEKDAEMLEALGLTATTHFGGAGQQWMPEWTEVLAGKQVVILPDTDKVGRDRGNRIAKALAGHCNAIQVVVPEGKDVTEYLSAGRSLDDLLRLVATSRRDSLREQLAARGCLSQREVVDVSDYGLGGVLNPSCRPKGLQTRLKKFNDITLGFQPRDLWILAARPGCGKTALAMDFALDIAKGGHPVAFFSMEMSAESLLMRMLCAESRLDSRQYRSTGFIDPDRPDLYRGERDRIRRALDLILELPLYTDDRSSLTLDEMRQRVDRLAERCGRVEFIVIDYLQLMVAPQKESRNQEVNALSRGLKLMAKDTGIPILCLSQLSRAVEQRQGDHRPQLSDLRDSGGIEQDADGVMFIYRQELYEPQNEKVRGKAELIISKQRNGPMGMIPMSFCAGWTSFEPPAEEIQ